MTLNTSELTDAVQRHTLALFLGPDLPREITGLPARADMARELARRKGLDESLALAEVAQRVGQAGNRWEFTDFLRNALDTAGRAPVPFHQRVVALVQEHGIETIITTAYDNLLELAFQGAGTGLNRVVRGADVNFVVPGRPTLIKLYGDAGQPDTLVVTDRDHSDLLRDRDREALVDEVRRAFRRNTVLFLGYNLADPDFRFLFDQVAESRFAHTAYAIWPGLSEGDMQMWRDRGIAILEADPWGILPASGASASLPQRPEPVVTPSGSPPPTEEGDRDRPADVGFPAELLRFLSRLPDDGDPRRRQALVTGAGFGRLTNQINWGGSALAFYSGLLDLLVGEGQATMTAFLAGLLGSDVLNLGVEDRATLERLHDMAASLSPEAWQQALPAERPGGRPSDSAPVVTPPSPVPPAGEGEMDYRRGLAQLRACLEQRAPDALAEFNVLEARLDKNARDERVFGDSENTRQERAKIIYSLNDLALRYCAISFNDLSRGARG